MRTEIRHVDVGEWLGEVPDNWDYNAFYEKHLSPNREQFERAVETYKAINKELKEGNKVIAITGDFSHEVYFCGLYDGWPYWAARPCYRYKGPISAEHIEEFYNLTGFKKVKK